PTHPFLRVLVQGPQVVPARGQHVDEVVGSVGTTRTVVGDVSTQGTTEADGPHPRKGECLAPALVSGGPGQRGRTEQEYTHPVAHRVDHTHALLTFVLLGPVGKATDSGGQGGEQTDVDQCVRAALVLAGQQVQKN